MRTETGGELAHVKLTTDSTYHTLGKKTVLKGLASGLGLQMHIYEGSLLDGKQ